MSKIMLKRFKFMILLQFETVKHLLRPLQTTVITTLKQISTDRLTKTFKDVHFEIISNLRDHNSSSNSSSFVMN